MQGRVHKSKKNLIENVFFQFVYLLVQFATRSVFIHYLSSEYLGITGLFSNILSILSVAELGIGSAIVYNLYPALAFNDKDRIRALVQFYKKVYFIIGIVIIGIGLCLIPFLDIFVGEQSIKESIPLIYIIYLMTTSITYFYGYIQALISADQKMYIISRYTGVIRVITFILQCSILVITKSFIAYLLVDLITNFLLNYSLYKKGKTLYTYIYSKEEGIPLTVDDKETFIKNMQAMFCHKLASAAVFATDNILISMFVSLSMVGIYSNYILIVTSITSFYSLFFTSITASIGNYVSLNNDKKNLSLFWKINFMGYSIALFCSVCLINLLTPFIGSIWLRDSSYTLSYEIVLAIVISFFITRLRSSLQTFRSVLGIFSPDKYKAIVEAIINLVMSVIFIHYFGFIGVILGTIFSSITVCLAVEPYVTFKYGFHTSCISYYKKYLYYIFVASIIISISILVNSYITSTSILWFILRLIISSLCAIIGIIVFFFKTKEFKYCVEQIKKGCFH